jgi:hypothetical protein
MDRRQRKRLARVLIAGAIWTVGLMNLGGLIVGHSYANEPGPERRARDVAELRTILPQMESIRLEGFYDLDGCRRVTWSEGAWASTDQNGCTWALGSRADAGGPEQFESVRAMLERTGVWVHSLTAEYGPDGKLKYAEFDLRTWFRFAGFSYRYEPGYTPPGGVSLPYEMEYYGIDDDWYYVWQDWN